MIPIKTEYLEILTLLETTIEKQRNLQGSVIYTDVEMCVRSAIDGARFRGAEFTYSTVDNYLVVVQRGTDKRFALVADTKSVRVDMCNEMCIAYICMIRGNYMSMLLRRPLVLDKELAVLIDSAWVLPKPKLSVSHNLVTIPDNGLVFWHQGTAPIDVDQLHDLLVKDRLSTKLSLREHQHRRAINMVRNDKVLTVSTLRRGQLTLVVNNTLFTETVISKLHLLMRVVSRYVVANTDAFAQDPSKFIQTMYGNMVDAVKQIEGREPFATLSYDHIMGIRCAPLSCDKDSSEAINIYVRSPFLPEATLEFIMSNELLELLFPEV